MEIGDRIIVQNELSIFCGWQGTAAHVHAGGGFVDVRFYNGQTLMFCRNEIESAMSDYRDAWIERKTASPERKAVLEKRMDDIQPRIAEGPGPVWDAFTKMLPGFHR